jgi:heat shock protein HslJ
VTLGWRRLMGALKLFAARPSREGSRMTRSASRRAFGLALVTCIVLAACGGDDDGGSPPTADDLDGRSFVATEIDGHDIVEGSEIVITFDAGTLVIEAGCNTQRGGYTIEDGVLSVDAMAATRMACDEALMTQDTLVAGIVASGSTVELDGDDLVVASPDTTMKLTARG